MHDDLEAEGFLVDNELDDETPEDVEEEAAGEEEEDEEELAETPGLDEEEE